MSGEPMNNSFRKRWGVVMVCRKAGWQAGAIVVACSILSGCATQTGSGGQAVWQIDAVAQKCIGAMVVGVGVGALLGAAAGGNRGAAIGAGSGLVAGGAVCAVIAELDAQDRERIRAAQLEAARTGRNQDMVYSGSDGLQRQIRVAPRVQPQPPQAQVQPARPRAASTPSTQVSTVAPPPMTDGPICRIVDTSAAIASKGTAEIPPQRFCRTPNGDWEPVADSTV